MSIDDNRFITNEEELWSRKLLSCLNSMPKNIEIAVFYDGSISIRNLGAGDRYLDEHGDIDAVPDIGILHPKTRKRIDGRDSVI